MTDKTPDVLERLRDDIPARPAPVDLLLHDAQAMRRRRRNGLASAAAAACVALTIGVAALPSLLDDGETSTIVAGQLLDPPPGTQLIGTGKVAIAVPEAWSTGVMCQPGRPGVAYYADLSDCAIDSDPEPTHVEVHPVENWGSPLGSPAATLRTLEGYEVRGEEPSCSMRGPATCSQIFGIPDLGAVFQVTITRPDVTAADVNAVQESLVILGDAQTAVPSTGLTLEQAEGSLAVDRTTAALRAAGFEVEVSQTECDDTGYCLLGVVGTTPAAGSVVRSGSTVTIDVIR